MESTLSQAQVAHLSKSVDELEMSARAALCLERANLTTIGQLVQIVPEVAIATRLFGRKAVNELSATLEPIGLSLGMELTPELAAQFPLPQGPALR